MSPANSLLKDGETQPDRPPIIQGNYQNTDVQQNDLALRGNRDSLVRDVSNDNFSQTVSADSTSASSPVDLTGDAGEFRPGEERV